MMMEMSHSGMIMIRVCLRTGVLSCLKHDTLQKQILFHYKIVNTHSFMINDHRICTKKQLQKQIRGTPRVRGMQNVFYNLQHCGLETVQQWRRVCKVKTNITKNKVALTPRARRCSSNDIVSGTSEEVLTPVECLSAISLLVATVPR